MPTFSPDSVLVTEVVPSPNLDERKDGRRPDMILLHYTGMETGDAALQRLTIAPSKVSSHYVVFEDGRIVQCVPEALRAWHAGVSSWAGESDINSCSIGIEIVNPGHEFGYPDFPLRQIAAVIAPGTGRSGPTVCWRIPTWRRRASRIRARSFPGSCSAIPASAIGCARQGSISPA
jgi:N-acetylmuramoyl-L-alanine amidase